jgi:hypothetical protein
VYCLLTSSPTPVYPHRTLAIYGGEKPGGNGFYARLPPTAGRGHDVGKFPWVTMLENSTHEVFSLFFSVSHLHCNKRSAVQCVCSSTLGMRSFPSCAADWNWTPVDRPSSLLLLAIASATLCFRPFLIPVRQISPSFLATQVRSFVVCGLGFFLLCFAHHQPTLSYLELLPTGHFCPANSLSTRAMCLACLRYKSMRMFSLGAWALVSG